MCVLLGISGVVARKGWINGMVSAQTWSITTYYYQ